MMKKSYQAKFIYSFLHVSKKIRRAYNKKSWIEEEILNLPVKLQKFFQKLVSSLLSLYSSVCMFVEIFQDS